MVSLSQAKLSGKGNLPYATTKRQVAAMFAEERRALLPLPVEPFRYTVTKVEATGRFPFRELRGERR